MAEAGTATGWHCTTTTVKQVVTVVACFLLTCTLGISYTFGNIDPYVTSYLRNATEGHDLDYTMTLWFFQTASLANSLALPVVGLLATRIHLKLFLLMGFGFFAASLFGTYFTLLKSFWWVMVTYGFLAGIPGAFMYPTCIRVSVQWFPSKPGLLTGINLMGYGIGSVAWNTLTTWYINPDNLQPDLRIGQDVYYTQHSVLERVPHCFMLLGIVFATIHIVCLIAIRPPPVRKPLTLIINGDEEEASDEATRPLLKSEDSREASNVQQICTDRQSNSYGAILTNSSDAYQPVVSCVNPNVIEAYQQRVVQEDGPRLAAVVEERVDYTPGQALSTTMFWTIWLMCFFIQIGVAFPISLWKAYGATFISDDHFLGIVASVSSIFNAICRPPAGILADKLGTRMVCLCFQCTMAVFVVTIGTCEYTGQGAFFVWVCAMFLAMCGFYTMIPTMLMKCFGTEHYNAIQGLCDLSGVVGAILPTVMAPTVKSAFGWNGLFIFSFVALFIGIILNMCMGIRWRDTAATRQLIAALDR